MPVTPDAAGSTAVSRQDAGSGLRLLSGAIARPQPPPADAQFQQQLQRILSGDVTFSFHYQPIIELRTAMVVGYEGLVRFGGALNWPPDRWFSAAAELGLRHALEHAVTGELLARRGHIPRDSFLSINVSPSFVLSPGWRSLIERLPTLAGVVIEITENESVADYAPLLEEIRRIRLRGGSVAVDDTGSGYASLQHVIALRPDFVKLDRVFVAGCDTDRAKSALIEMVGNAAGRLDAWIIAEGVETAGELDELIRLHVPLAQGYFLARPHPEMAPLPPDKIKAIVRRAQVFAAPHSIEGAMEFCPLCPALGGAIELLESDAQLVSAVVTDSFGRPTHLVERHPLAGIREVPSPMRAQTETPAREALERALTRPLASRWDPLLAIHETGEFAGIVSLDRLVRQALPGARQPMA